MLNIFKKYYFFSATFSDSHTITQNFGSTRYKLMSNQDFKNVIIEIYPNAKDIVILSVCLLSKKQYHLMFFS